MLEDPKKAIIGLEKLVTLTKDASDIEGAGIFAAITILCRDWQEHNIKNEIGGYAILNQKLIGIEQHIRAMFDFENHSGHTREAHFQWAYGDLHDLMGLLK